MRKPLSITPDKELALPADQQAAIACNLISSLNPGMTQGNEHAWLKEAERRRDGYLRGEIEGRPATQVIEEIKIKY